MTGKTGYDKHRFEAAFLLDRLPNTSFLTPEAMAVAAQAHATLALAEAIREQKEKSE